MSWHHGWVLHAAGPQPAHAAPRVALTAMYFADGARLLPRKVLQERVHSEDRESYSAWLPDLKAEGFVRHPLLPVVYDARKGNGHRTAG